MDQITETKHFLRCELSINDETHFKRTIKESNAVIAFVFGTKHNRIRKEYEIAKEAKKIILNVTIDSMFRWDDFRTVEIKEPIKSVLNRKSFLKLNALFNRSIQRGKYFYMDQNSIYFELISSSSCYPSFYEEESPILMNCEIISNQEVLINYSVDNIDINKSVILDINTGIEFSKSADYFKIYWIDHLNKFLIADKRSKSVYFYGKNLQLDRMIMSLNMIDFDLVDTNSSNICYNKFNKTTIVTSKKNDKINLYNFDQNFSKMTLIKETDSFHVQIISGYLCQYDETLIYFYDNSHELVATVCHPFPDCRKDDIQIISDTTKISKYAFIRSDYSSVVHVLDTSAFNFVGVIDFKIPIKNIFLVFNDKIMLQGANTRFYVYKLKLNSQILETVVDSRYICKINPFKSHLLHHTVCLLPCGQSYCMDCIFDNYNLYLQKFNCNFEICKQPHVLRDESMKINLKLSKLVNENFPDFINSVLLYGNSFRRNDLGLIILKYII